MQHPVATPIRLHPKHYPIPINTPTTRHPVQPTSLSLYQLHQQRIGSLSPSKRMQHLKAGAILSYPIHHAFAVRPPFLRHSVEPSVLGGEDTGIGQGAIRLEGEEGTIAGGSSCGGSAVEVLVGILGEGSEGEGAVLVGGVGLEGGEGMKDTKAGAVWREPIKRPHSAMTMKGHRAV